MKNINPYIICVIILLPILSCNDCAETTYTNYPAPDEVFKNAIPYQTGEVMIFQNKNSVSEKYELIVENRERLDIEYQQVEQHNTHLGIICELHDPVHIYLSSFYHTILNFGNENSDKSNRETIGILIGNTITSQKPFMSFHNNQRDIYHIGPGSDFKSIYNTGLSLNENSVELSDPKVGPLEVQNQIYEKLYKLDTFKLTNYNFADDEFIVDVIFTGALYSTEYGFVRFILPSNDTLDLIN